MNEMPRLRGGRNIGRRTRYAQTVRNRRLNRSAEDFNNLADNVNLRNRMLQTRAQKYISRFTSQLH